MCPTGIQKILQHATKVYLLWTKTHSNIDKIITMCEIPILLNTRGVKFVNKSKPGDIHSYDKKQGRPTTNIKSTQVTRAQKFKSHHSAMSTAERSEKIVFDLIGKIRDYTKTRDITTSRKSLIEYVFKIAIWNANGLPLHSLEISFIKTQGLDNILICTTNHPNGTTRGGSAVVIRNSIKHYSGNKYQIYHIQSSSVVIKDHQGKITISAIYCLPRHSINEKQYTTLAIDFLQEHQRWGSRLATPKGRGKYWSQSLLYRKANILATRSTQNSRLLHY